MKSGVSEGTDPGAAGLSLKAEAVSSEAESHHFGLQNKRSAVIHFHSSDSLSVLI